MEEFIEKILNVNEPKMLFLLCGIFIFTDVITGYLKSFKHKKVNSSISRDGYIKKIAWIIALILGFAIDYFIQINLFLIGSAIVCIATEGISIYENLNEVGIHLPFQKYFAKMNTGETNEKG